MKKAVKTEEEKSRQDSDFIARISHELRTPLSAIMGFTEQLMQSRLDAQQEKYLKIIDKSAEHMLSLINDLLVFSKAEANKIRFDENPFSLMDTVRYAVTDMEYKAKEKELDLIYETDKRLNVIVLGDAFRLRQILNNLLSNAVKFTSEGSVKLTVTLEDEEDNTYYVMFRVIDTGRGISKDNLKKIFNPYRQADPRVSIMEGGTGLGLTICKSLIELQGGNLEVKSEPGKGSEFKVVLPYKKTDLINIKDADQGELDTSILRGKKILLVDDDSINRLLGETVLRKMNCDTTVTDSGEESINILSEKSFDLILLDMQMPGLDGYDVADYVRNKKKDRKTKIIAFTAATAADQLNKFREAGIEDFVIKPYRERYLQNKICKVLGMEYKKEMKSSSEVILGEGLTPSTYDLSKLRSMVNNDKKIINTAITDFIKNSEDAIISFKRCIADKNRLEAGETAHKLIPSYSHLRVNKTLTKLKAIDLRSKNEEDDPGNGLFEELVEDTIAEIKEVIKKMKDDFYR